MRLLLIIIFLLKLEFISGQGISSSAIKNEEKKSKEIIGKIIPNTEDPVLLKLIYGSCYKADGAYVYNWGPQIWEDKDSVYMKVKERFGDDTTQIIYLRGEMAITDVMHNFYNESALILNKTKKGWKVMDGYIDRQIIDYSSVEIKKTYGNMFLIIYETSGVYAMGVQSSDVEYSLITQNNFNGPSVSFILSSSNTASNQCMTTEDTTACNCYSYDGKDIYRYDETLKCLVFDYTFNKHTYTCNMKTEHVDHAYQTWYMNADTSFLVKGNIIKDYGNDIQEKVNLNDIEIRKRLKANK